MDAFQNVTTLTFDVYGTCLDLDGPIVSALDELLKRKGSDVPADVFRKQWRARQRLEQYQDTLLMVGHSGYLETSRKAFLYILRQNDVSFDDGEVESVMKIWWDLSPFDDVVPALGRLKQRYKLVALSNGDPKYLSHIARRRIGWDWDDVISCTTAGVLAA